MNKKGNLLTRMGKLIKNKQGTGFNPNWLIIVALILVLYFGFAQTGALDRSCHLGQMSVSYNPLTDTHTLTGAISGRAGQPAGCLAVAGNSMANCINLENKVVTSKGHCTIYDDWSGTLRLVTEYDINNDLPFDGCYVDFGYAGNPWYQRNCNFEIKVSPKPAEVIQKPEVKEQTLIEKIFNPTPVVEESQVGVPPPQKLTLFQKINLAIDNFFSWLFGGNK